MDLNRDSRCGFGLDNVSVRGVRGFVLRDVHISLHPGEFHALIGNPGSGKTAIARVLTGSLPFSSGVVRLDGREYGRVSPRAARGHGVFLVSDIPKVFPRLTVAESLLSGDALWRRALRPWRGFIRDAKEWLDREGVSLNLNATLDSLPEEDWIFVEILGRLFRHPRVLILDEALERLAPPRKRALMPILRRQMRDGLCVLWITHKIDDAMVLADRLSVVRDGALLLSSRPEGLDHLNLIRLCYAEIEDLDSVDFTMHQFHQLVRFTGALVRDLPQTVAIIDAEGIVRFLNRKAREAFMADGENGLGMRLESFFGPDNMDFAAKARRAMADGGDGDWHNVRIRAGGANILADITLRRIPDHAAASGFILQIEDVSAREELRRRAVLSDNLASIGLLAAGVAHEVNNPLEILGNYMVFLGKNLHDDGLRRVLAKMEDEAVRIQHIVNNLVVFSGGADAGTARVDVRALCLELCELLRFHNKEHRIRFHIPQPDFDVLVRADRNEMRQVFLNLFKNSIAAVGGGGEIAIAFERVRAGDGAWVHMRFSDNGCGIHLENPDEVFLPFVTSRAEGGRNHGLGLFIVFGIVEKYGGVIHARNRESGGCEFTITLPLAEQHGQ